jgi:hypothetical protein
VISFLRRKIRFLPSNFYTEQLGMILKITDFFVLLIIQTTSYNPNAITPSIIKIVNEIDM